jgi:hypothetical protein
MKATNAEEDEKENDEERQALTATLYKEKVAGLVKLAEKAGCAEMLAEIM